MLTPSISRHTWFKLDSRSYRQISPPELRIKPVKSLASRKGEAILAGEVFKMGEAEEEVDRPLMVLGKKMRAHKQGWDKQGKQG